MKKISLTDEERAAWLDIERAAGRRLARDVDDDERRRDNARWDERREREEERRRIDADPYFTRLREAAGATGGESCRTPTAKEKPSEEDG